MRRRDSRFVVVVVVLAIVVTGQQAAGADSTFSSLTPTDDLSIEHVVDLCAAGLESDAAADPRGDDVSASQSCGGSGPPPGTPNPNGVSSTLQIGGTAYGDPESGYATRWTSLFDFDLSGVPAGASISSAVLTVEARKTGDVVDAFVAPIIEAWDETTTELPLISPDGRVFTTISPAVDTAVDVTVAVEAWQASGGHGLAIGFQEGSVPGMVEVYSREKPAFQATLDLAFGEGPAPLSVTTTDPNDGATVSGTISLAANATGDDIDQVEFFVDGTSVAVDASPPFEASWDSSSVVDGAHTIQATVTDLSGATATDSVSVSVDNSMPVADDPRTLLDSDFESGAIKVDEYVKTALQLVAQDPDLDPRFQGQIQGDGATSWLFGVLTWVGDVKPPTLRWIEDYLTPEQQEQAPADAPSAQSQGAATIGDASCGIFDLYRTLWVVTDCAVQIGQVTLRWDSGELGGGTGMALPDPVAGFADGFSDSLEHYDRLDYPAPDPTTAVVHPRDIRAWALPRIPGLNPAGQIHLDPTSPTPALLAAHELFHQVEFEYLGLLEYIDTTEGRPLTNLFNRRLARVLWWLEASAEWAAHQVMETYPVRYAGTEDFFDYAEWLPRFMGDASSPLPRWTREDNRQYGAFVVAEWLHDWGGEDTIRQVWAGVNVLNDPLEVMDTLPAFGLLGLGELLPVMWSDIYFLDIAPTSPFSLRDHQATVDTWRDVLNASAPRFTGAPFGNVARLPAERRLDFTQGESETWDLEIGGGGVAVLELDATEPGDFAVTVTSSTPISVTSRALADFNVDPEVGPVGDECTAAVSALPHAGTQPRIVHVTDYDPTDCEGLAVLIINDDWTSPDLTPVTANVGYYERLGFPITFSEVPVGTAVTDQYDHLGIIFGGDSPITASDGSNVNSPVLGGVPLFHGDITMEIVAPGTTAPATTDQISFDLGYLDNANGVVVTTYDLAGDATSTSSYGCCGIQRITISQPGTQRLVIDVQDFEGNGAAIDNVTFQ